MLKLRRIKPIGCQVLVSENLYGWDDFDESGLIMHKRGDIKTYQEVIAVGDDVKFVKPGDTVEVNLYKYAVFKEDPNSIKAMEDNPIVGLRLNEVEMSGENDETVPCMLIDQRDVKYVLEDFEEVTYQNKKLVTIEKPSHKLILPNNRIKA